jgi:hypothetical protein
MLIYSVHELSGISHGTVFQKRLQRYKIFKRFPNILATFLYLFFGFNNSFFTFLWLEVIP